MFNKRLVGTLIISLIFINKAAFSNGINPPRPSASKPIKAVCYKKEGDNIELYRARIETISENESSIEVKIDQKMKVLPVERLKVLLLSSNQIDKNGFTQATIELDNYERKISALVRVRKNKYRVQLIGYIDDKNNEKPWYFRYELNKCQKIEFTHERHIDDEYMRENFRSGRVKLR